MLVGNWMSPPLKQNCHLWRIDLSLILLPLPSPASTHNHKMIHGPKNMEVAWDIIQSLTEVQSRSKFTFMMKVTHQSETLDIKKDLL